MGMLQIVDLDYRIASFPTSVVDSPARPHKTPISPRMGKVKLGAINKEERFIHHVGYCQLTFRAVWKPSIPTAVGNSVK